MKNRRHQMKCVCIVLALLVFLQVLFAQNITQDERLNYLIESRKNYSWDRLYIQFAPSFPPASQPVTHLPEWEAAGYMLMAVDESTIASLKFNKACNTFGLGNELINGTLSEDDKLNITEILGDKIKEDKAISFLVVSHIFLKVIKALSEDIKVLLLVDCNSDDEDELIELLKHINEYPEGPGILNSENIIFLTSPLDSKWIRDYGPEFARDKNGRLIILDSRYEIYATPGNKIESYLKLISSMPGDQSSKKQKDEFQQKAMEVIQKMSHNRLQDDATPSLLALRLRERDKGRLLPYPINVIRPPLKLDGGDFLSNGQGIGFTSTNTLVENGGDVSSLNIVFEKYFGLKDVVYLTPLPGSAIKHIDMFFQIVSTDTYLLATFEDRTGTEDISPLQIEAQRVLDFNERILSDFFLSKGKKVNILKGENQNFDDNAVNIVRIPIPDLRRPYKNALKKIYNEYSNLDFLNELLLMQKNEYEKLLEFLNERVKHWNDRKRFLETHSEGEITSKNFLELKKIGNKVKEFFENPITYALEFELVGEDSPAYIKALGFNDFLEKSVEGIMTSDPEIKVQLSSHLINLNELSQNFLDEFQSNILRIKDSLNETLADLEELEKRRKHLYFEANRLTQVRSRGSDIYNTYLNLHFVRTQTKNILLIPSFNGDNAFQTEVFSLIERAYAWKYGPIKIIPVPSNHLADQQGSIHCLSKSIPIHIDVLGNDWGISSPAEEVEIWNEE